MSARARDKTLNLYKSRFAGATGLIFLMDVSLSHSGFVIVLKVQNNSFIPSAMSG